MSAAQHPAKRRPFPRDLLDWFDAGLPSFGSLTEGTHKIPVEITKEEGTYVLRAELPGMDPEEIEVTAEGDVLTVRAEHTETTTDKQHSEFRYGSFTRSVRLPAPVPRDGVEAAYEDGILTVRVPLAEPDESPRTITVRKGTS
ncbi:MULTISPECIES: Hsp20/alpha crystallin family protein [unclassified Streptomyces]|uniref:Hsp20/alpha crystallin family protein n=1 Tax=unclassified Streptomyces TaxID=2593676 RepID=UPI0008DDCFAB|nr:MULTISPECIES: Hsp20/alpha crystallin family protein [unclassified Streptomyces]OII66679.1 hypothetical protein BJP39_27370 [Streptomyces sp. CC77]